MARESKAGYRSRTFRFSDEMMDELKAVAEYEGRTVTAQMERYIKAGIAETKKAMKAEKTPGQRVPARVAATTP